MLGRGMNMILRILDEMIYGAHVCSSPFFYVPSQYLQTIHTKCVEWFV